MTWYAVRCIFSTRVDSDEGTLYEERITLWSASDASAAIGLAESEAERYAAETGCEYLELAQSFQLDEEPGAGAEIFSLFRQSDLDASSYLDRFFDTGDERQTL